MINEKNELVECLDNKEVEDDIRKFVPINEKVNKKVNGKRK